MKYFIDATVSLCELDTPMIVRVDDDEISFFSENSLMYSEYQAWLAEGNTPEPWEPEQ